jgi:hypothetical protein
MLTGRKIDNRFLDKWERDLCSELERDTDRLAGRLVKDFGPLHNGLFPRTIDRRSG